MSAVMSEKRKNPVQAKRKSQGALDPNPLAAASLEKSLTCQSKHSATSQKLKNKNDKVLFGLIRGDPNSHLTLGATV